MTLPLQRKMSEYYSRIKIMSILCNRSSSYCSKIKNILSLLVILLSACVAITTGIYENTKSIKIPVVILNSVIALLIGIDRGFKFSEKSANFKKYSQSYNKLIHEIDKERNKTEDAVIKSDFFNFIITLYDNITDGITDEFPDKIINQMKQEYENTEDRNLPFFLEKMYCPADYSFSKKNYITSPFKKKTRRKSIKTSPFLNTLEPDFLVKKIKKVSVNIPDETSSGTTSPKLKKEISENRNVFLRRSSSDSGYSENKMNSIDFKNIILDTKIKKYSSDVSEKMYSSTIKGQSSIIRRRNSDSSIIEKESSPVLFFDTKNYEKKKIKPKMMSNIIIENNVKSFDKKNSNENIIIEVGTLPVIKDDINFNNENNIIYTFS